MWLIAVAYVAFSRVERRIMWAFAVIFAGPIGLVAFLAFSKRLPPKANAVRREHEGMTAG